MLANFFSKSKPINYVVIIGLFFSYFSVATFVSLSWDDLSVNYVFKLLGIFCFFLLLFLVYNFIIIKNNLTFDNSYAFLFLVLFLGFFIDAFLNIKTLTMFLLQLLFLRKVYALQSSEIIFQKLFDAGFWLGILFVFTPFFSVFFLLLYGAVYLHQKITIRTLLIPIIGFMSPLILCFAYWFWIDKVEEFQQLFYFFTDYNLSIYSQNLFLMPLILICLCTIITLFLKTPKALSISNVFKRSWILVILNLLISVGFILFLSEKNGSEIIFLLFPVSIIVGNGLEVITINRIKDIFLTLLIACPFLLPFIIV